MKREEKKIAALFLCLKMSSHIEMLTDNVRVRGWEREASGMWKLEVVVRLSFHVSYFFLAILHPVQNVCKCNTAERRNIWGEGNCETVERKEQERKRALNAVEFSMDLS